MRLLDLILNPQSSLYHDFYYTTRVVSRSSINMIFNSVVDKPHFHISRETLKRTKKSLCFESTYVSCKVGSSLPYLTFYTSEIKAFYPSKNASLVISFDI